MDTNDIPKSILLKVMRACWQDFSNVPCWKCEDRVRPEADAMFPSIDHDCGTEFGFCDECNDRAKAHHQHIHDHAVTVASPECVVLAPWADYQPPIRPETNDKGVEGFTVTLCYNYRMTCQHCDREMPEWGATYFVSNDGENIELWSC